MTRALPLLLALTAITAGGGQALAADTGREVSPPYGYVAYCLRVKADCMGGTDAPQTVAMTAARWSELNAVNDFVNALPQVEDIDRYGVTEYWAVADDKGGDCEDLALRKRAELISRGWPASALLMTVVREWSGDGHAVLTVVTDQGELILDNKARTILHREEAPYVFLKRQSAYRPWVWLDMESPSPIAINYPPVDTTPPFISAVEKARNNVGGIR